MKEKVKCFVGKYNHAFVFLYALIYMPWFLYLERHVTKDYYLIHSPLDDYIPFVEYFIVPYLMWFLFLGAGALYLFFKDKREFLRMAAFQIAGMTIFLIICTVFPNGLHLRPETFARDNIFVDLVRFVYSTDTPTNVLPSMHVFNSVGICIGLSHTETLKNRRMVMTGVYTLTLLIILSTMFLKQHSVTDVIAALVMSGVLYQIVYAYEGKHARKLMHEPVI